MQHFSKSKSAFIYNADLGKAPQGHNNYQLQLRDAQNPHYWILSDHLKIEKGCKQITHYSQDDGNEEIIQINIHDSSELLNWCYIGGSYGSKFQQKGCQLFVV